MNYGRNVNGIEFVTSLSQAIRVLNSLRNGQIFRIDFMKKTTGSMRTMVCRCGVKKGQSGKGASFSFEGKGLLPVYEFGKGYRSIPIDNIKAIKKGGTIYRFDVLNPQLGVHRSAETNIVGRTVPAYTSPMYASV